MTEGRIKQKTTTTTTENWVTFILKSFFCLFVSFLPEIRVFMCACYRIYYYFFIFCLILKILKMGQWKTLEHNVDFLHDNKATSKC